MKKLFIVLVLIALFIPASANAAEDDRWILIGSSDETDCFFDGETLMADNYSKNIITVWIKWQHTPSYAQEFVKKYNFDKKKYKNYSYTIQKVQLDIKTRKYAIISAIDYTTTEVINHTNFPFKWDDIIPDSEGEYVFEKIKDYYLKNYE